MMNPSASAAARRKVRSAVPASISGGFLTNAGAMPRSSNADLRLFTVWFVAARSGQLPNELGATPSQVAIARTRKRTPAIHPIIGARRLDQLLDNLGAVDVDLPSEAVAQLEAATAIDFGFPTTLISETRSVLGLWCVLPVERITTFGVRGPGATAAEPLEADKVSPTQQPRNDDARRFPAPPHSKRSENMATPSSDLEFLSLSLDLDTEALWKQAHFSSLLVRAQWVNI